MTDKYPTDEEFNKWWNEELDTKNNPYRKSVPAYWAWEGWVAGRKAEREACAVIAFNAKTYIEAAEAIRARGQDGS